jgi:hypothetical protein
LVNLEDKVDFHWEGNVTCYSREKMKGKELVGPHGHVAADPQEKDVRRSIRPRKENSLLKEFVA